MKSEASGWGLELSSDPDIMMMRESGVFLNMHCPQCGAEDVIEIKNRVEEIEIDFFSCHRCEEKWWDKSGKSVSLREVLEIVRRART